jgi:hypothetical protein
MTTRIHNIVKDGKDGAVIDVADGLILHECGVIIHKAIVFWPEI